MPHPSFTLKDFIRPNINQGVVKGPAAPTAMTGPQIVGAKPVPVSGADRPTVSSGAVKGPGAPAPLKPEQFAKAAYLTYIKAFNKAAGISEADLNDRMVQPTATPTPKPTPVPTPKPTPTPKPGESDLNDKAGYR